MAMLNYQRVYIYIYRMIYIYISDIHILYSIYIYIYPLVMTNIAMENPQNKWRFYIVGKSSISMGHLYHGYVKLPEGIYIYL